MALGDKRDRRFGRGRRDVSGIRVPGTGPCGSGILLVGERPGYQDAAATPPTPYSGIGGTELTRYLAAGGINRSQCYITYQVKDYKEGENPTADEIERDKEELEVEILANEPGIIAAMGKTVAQYLLGPDVDMELIHGIPHWYSHPDLGPIIVVPISHPPAAFYNGDNQQQIIEDCKALGAVYRGESFPLDTPPKFRIFRPEFAYPAFAVPHAQEYSTRLALDTEGWLHNPWGLSACTRHEFGYVVKKGEPTLVGLNDQIRSATATNPDFLIYLHNALHDLGVLDALGIDIPEGSYRDTMVWAYLLCTEPQGLKPLSYRHLGLRMKSYDDVTKLYYDAVFEEYVRTAAELDSLPDWEEEFCVLEGGAPKIKRPWGIARHLRKILKDAEKAASEGRSFDFAQRWNNIDDYKKIRVIREVGEPPEPSLDLVPDQEAVDYSGGDAVVTRYVGPILEAKISEMGLTRVSEIDHSVLPMFARMQKVGVKADPDYYDRLAEECTEEMSRVQHEIQALTGAMINPDSGDQVAALIFDSMKLDKAEGVEFDIKKTETGDRYSTNDKILEAIRFTHPVVGLVCDYREISKVRSSFCWPISRYARQDRNHRIHPNFRLTRVSSGRPSCTKPNLLAIPVRTALGKRVRAGLIADDGCVHYDIDLSQIEMRYMADESQDEALLYAFHHGIDVHDQTGSMLSSIPLEKYCADKPTRKKWRDPAKRVNFGVITGITAKGLVAQMRLANSTKNGKPMEDGGDPWTEKDCQGMLDNYFAGHPGVRDYMDRCRAEARRYGYVRDRWGRIRYLPGAHSPINHIREEALRQSHSHKIQAGAAGLMKQAQAQVWECIKQWWKEGRYVEPLLQVYDELLIELADEPDLREEVDFMSIQALTQTVTLSVPLGAEGGFGHNWTEAKG